MRLAQFRPSTGISLICAASTEPPTSAEVRFSVSSEAVTSTASVTGPTSSRASMVRGCPTTSSTPFTSVGLKPSLENVTVYVLIGSPGIW